MAFCNSKSSRNNPVRYSSDSEDDFQLAKKSKDTIQEPIKKKKFAKKFECSLCHYCTDLKSNLERHVGTHGGQKNSKFECSTCSYKTDHSNHWKQHVNSNKHKSLLGLQTNEGKMGCAYPDCSFVSKKLDTLHAHLSSFHSIELEREEKVFATETEFKAWKNGLMEHAIEKFTRHGGSGNSKFYRCHRSGEYTPKEEQEGVRNLKKLGSIKCGKVCPANIVLTIMENAYHVKYCGTHIGHKMEAGRVGISSPQKRQIASMIVDGVATHRIVEKMAENHSFENIVPVQLLTNKDIENIGRKYGVENTIKLSDDDARSVHLKVLQLQEANDTSIFLYKPYGENSTEYPIPQEEFVLAYMNQAQEHLLKTCGKKIICIDGTHGTNSYGFELSTLLTIDDNFQGFPVAFFFHSSKSENTYEVFYKALRSRVGILEVDVFMSDNEPAFYNAWTSVMCTNGLAPRKLLCMWYVLRAWFKRISKLKTSPDEKNQLFQKMRAIMQELSENVFELAIKNLLAEVSRSEPLQEIVEYLKSYYERRSEWACCYRLHSGINTNMRLERMHREIKYTFLKGKRVKRLDVGIHGVLQNLRALQQNRLVSNHRGKLTSKDRDLRQAHIRSAEGATSSVKHFDGFWVVPSFTDPCEQYTIRRNKDNCKCDTRCPKCTKCIHAFNCSCYENSIRSNMCKHIHLLCRHLANDTTPVSEGEDDFEDLIIDTDDFIESREAEANFHQLDLLSTPNNSSTISVQDVQSTFQLALQEAKKLKRLDILQSCLNEAMRQLAAEDVPSSFNISSTCNASPGPSKIVPQMRRFVPKKRTASNRRCPPRGEIMKSLLIPRLLQDTTIVDTAGEDVRVDDSDVFGVEFLELDVGANEDVGMNSQ